MFGFIRNLFGMVVEGRSSQWAAIRADHLRREPRCVACGTDKFLTVHHVRPVALFPELELKNTDEQLITLCETPSRNCHYIFGHGNNTRLWNPTARQDAMRYRRLLEGLKVTRE